MLKKTTILTCWVFFAIQAITAQNYKIGSPIVTNFSREATKAGPQNWAIDQDSRNGNLYFGNNDGLLEYSKEQWNLTPIPNKTIVRSLIVHAESGRIYVGGQGTFGFFSRNSQGKLEYSCLSDSIEDPQFRNFDDVWRVFIVDGAVFFNTYKMVARYQQGQPLEIFPSGENTLEFAFSIRNSVYAFRQQEGLVKLDIKSGSFNLVTQGGKFKDKLVKAILPYEENTLLIATEQHGLYIFDGENEPMPWLPEKTSFLNKTFINAGATLHNGYVFATKYNGVVIVDKYSGNLIAQIDKEHGLPNDNVICFKEDENKNLWLGLHNGIAKVIMNSPWNFVFINQYGQIGAHSSVIYKEKLYLATPNGLFAKQFQEKEILGQEFSLVEGTEGEAWNLSIIQSKFLFLGHHNGAYCICDDGHLELLDNALGYWKFLEVPGNPNLMLAGNYSGLVLFEKNIEAKCGWKLLRKIKSESSRIMAFENENTLWMTHVYKGIWRYKFSDKFSKFSISYIGKDNYKVYGLPSINKINVFKIDNRVVFGTEKGVYSFNGENFELDKTFSKFFSDTTFISYMVQDDQDNIWFWGNGRPGKLKKIDGKGYERVVFPDLDFLFKNFKSNFEYIHSLGGDQAIFGTADGFFKYGINPSVTVVLPEPARANACLKVPWFIFIMIFLFLAIMLALYLFWRIKKMQQIIQLPGSMQPLEEMEFVSDLALLVDYGYEQQLKKYRKKLNEPNFNPNEVVKKMEEFKNEVAVYEKHLNLYQKNRIWIKKLKQKIQSRTEIDKSKTRRDNFWKIAICVKNGKSEGEIANFLSIDPLTVKRNVNDLNELLNTKTIVELKEELRKLTNLADEDLINLNLSECFDQIKNGMHTPNSQLADLLANYLNGEKKIATRLSLFLQKNTWLRNLFNKHPDLTELDLLILIGLRHDLSAGKISFFTLEENGDKDMETKKIENRIKYLQEKKFKKDIDDLKILPKTLKEFIQNYPDQ